MDVQTLHDWTHRLVQQRHSRQPQRSRPCSGHSSHSTLPPSPSTLHLLGTHLLAEMHTRLHDPASTMMTTTMATLRFRWAWTVVGKDLLLTREMRVQHMQVQHMHQDLLMLIHPNLQLSHALQGLYTGVTLGACACL
jgi:hypothetical protein